ncbi:MFS transporter, partial [Mesorhizobium sp. M7A.F.Ca.CA.001.13.2.1]
MSIPRKNRSEAEQGAEPTPLIAIASVIVSMALIAVGNGLMFAYI